MARKSRVPYKVKNLTLEDEVVEVDAEGGISSMELDYNIREDYSVQNEYARHQIMGGDYLVKKSKNNPFMKRSYLNCTLVKYPKFKSIDNNYSIVKNYQKCQKLKIFKNQIFHLILTI